MDKIYIRGLRVYAYHGVKETEKEKGQPFELDITLEADLRRPGATDDLNDTVNYSKVTKRVLAVMQAEKRALWLWRMALGKPVVPEVYCILQTSCLEMAAARR